MRRPADGTDAWLGGSASWTRQVSPSAYGSDAITGVDGDFVGWGFGPFSAIAVTGVRQPGGGILRIHTGGHMIQKVSTDTPERSERTVLRDLEVLSGSGVPVYATRGPGGGFDAIGCTAIGNLVEINFENLVFGEQVFELDGARVGPGQQQ